jgi:hypothetical protein
MMLVTLEQAKAHIRVDFDDEDAEIEIYLKAASQAIVNYLQEGDALFMDSDGDIIEDSNGIAIDVTYEIKAATLLMVGYLYRYRDNNDGEAFEMGYLPKPVTALLYHLRKPGYA